MSHHPVSRRAFLCGFAGSLGATVLSGSLRAEDAPHIANPRATSGDRRSEPKWDERLTITVGPNKGDLIGKTDKVIQAAVDTVSRLGGGTVKILPGTYQMRN